MIACTFSEHRSVADAWLVNVHEHIWGQAPRLIASGEFKSGDRNDNIERAMEFARVEAIKALTAISASEPKEAG